MKKLPNLRMELRRARQYIKIFIPGPCDIGFQCSKMQIEANNAIYEFEFKNQDFETQVDIHEESRMLEEGVEKSP